MKGNGKNKKKLKKGVKILLCVLFLAVPCCGTLGYFVVWPKYQEMTRVGFMLDPNDATKTIYKDENHEIVYGAKTIDGKNYFFDEKTGWMITGSHQEKDGIRYYGDDGAMITGFNDQEDGKHYYDQNGLMSVGIQTIDNESYYFNDTGIMQVNTYKRGADGNENHISYFDENGHVVKGRRNIDGTDRFFDDNGNLAVDIEYLQNGVQEVLNQWSGDISFYFKDLNSNQSFTINDHTFYPCCMIKVPSLITIYNAISDGTIQKTDQVAHWIDLMIRISDNTSFNNLMILLGGGNGAAGVQKVTETAQALGMSDTIARHGLQPGDNFFSAGGSNKSCPKDLGLAFEKIYNHEVATPELCDEMIEILKTCDDYEELQAGLPEGTPFAHKTGCAFEIYNDGGIVYGPTGNYIIVCFSDKARYIPMMTAVSEFVYNYEANLIPEGV